MRIAEIAPLYESVPPRRYGGTERVVSYLTEELVGRGHDVTLFASGDSETSARLVPGWPRGLRLSGERVDPIAVHLGMLLRVYERARDFDVIHCHTDYLGLPLTRRCPIPTVATLHGRLDMPGAHPVYAAFPEVAYVSISDAQRAPVTGVSWAATVHHGLPRNLFAPGAGAGGYLLFLGRLSPEKCPDAAIRIAIAAGVRLRIAAKIDAVDRKFFESVVRPVLDHPLVEFLGEVDDERKEELLRDALALLFPIDWPEPFGLVAIESLACGTPVVARARGALPEIIENGRTGYLCESEQELIAAVGRLERIDRAACRQAFERRFTAARMADDYLNLFAARCLAASGRKAVAVVDRSSAAASSDA